MSDRQTWIVTSHVAAPLGWSREAVKDEFRTTYEETEDTKIKILAVYTPKLDAKIDENGRLM